jgi:hypothetical protein
MEWSRLQRSIAGEQFSFNFSLQRAIAGEQFSFNDSTSTILALVTSWDFSSTSNDFLIKVLERPHPQSPPSAFGAERRQGAAQPGHKKSRSRLT